MQEILNFHFEGALADSHRMNFYEASRFQYAAARLLVKLAQFRHEGKFVKNITQRSNFSIKLVSLSDGSFNINIESPTQATDDESFLKISLADLIAYVSERVIEKIDESTLSNVPKAVKTVSSFKDLADSSIDSPIDGLVNNFFEDSTTIDNIPKYLQDIVKRRAAEIYREQRLDNKQGVISRIDSVRSQKLIAMSAPLISEMAIALRESANTLEVTATTNGQVRPVLFLDRKMAEEIETSLVDKDITAILGDITQFNKDNGWGKLKIENGSKFVSFSIPYDLLPSIKKILIDNMKKDLVYLQTYFVRDRSNELTRLIVVGILPTPTV